MPHSSPPAPASPQPVSSAAASTSPASPISVWQLQALHLRRGQTQVFSDLVLHLEEPRIGLIGSNGAGKTSLLRMLAGLEQPQQGQLLWQGQARTQPSRSVGLMFQNPEDQIIYPTVQEELQLSWRSAHPGSSRAQAVQAVQQFLQQRGLPDWAERAVGGLSQGQRQWLCWLAQLIGQPQVLLLDEPYASLDLAGQLRLAADIAACSQQVLLSTHVLDYVRDYPRVLWLEQGRIRADGPGQEVCAAYESAVRSAFATQEEAAPHG